MSGTTLLVNAVELQAWLLHFTAVLARVGALVMVAPVFGSRLVPMRVRLVLAAALSVLLLGAVPEAAAGSPALGPLQLFREIALGAAIGFVLQTAFDALVVAGQVVSLSMGLGFANLVDPRHGATVPVIGQLYLLLATLVFLAMDGHIATVALLADSYRALPPGQAHLGADAMAALVAWGGRMMSGALQVALPAMVAMTVVNVAFGVISRAAPQMNLFAVGFPLAVILGFVMLWLSLPALASVFGAILDEAFDVAGSLAGGAR